MRFFRFQDFELDIELFSLTRSKLPVPLGRRSFDLLSYLARHRERAVPLDELVVEVWKTSAISPSAIPTCLMELRKLLDDDPQNPKIIETKKGRGYQFIATLSPPASADQFAARNPEELDFAGRDAELKRLCDTFSSVKYQHKSITVVIRGDAGIGKTRLLQEFIRSTRGNSNAFVLRCPEIDGAPSFLPWIRLREEIDNSMINRSAEVAEARATLGTLQRPQATRSDRYEYFASWSSLLKDLSKSAPVLIAIEDIHRTDLDTLELLKWVGSDLQNYPVMLVTTTRKSGDNRDIQNAVDRVVTQFCTITLDLPLLDQASLEKMVAGRTTRPDMVARELYRRTSGHPFFARHIMDSIPFLDTAEDLEDAINAMPTSTTELLAHQLGDLPNDTHEALKVGALFGDAFPLKLCAKIRDIGTPEFIHNLSPAISKGLITEVESDPMQMRFAHMILRDSLYDTLQPDERRDLHSKVADQLIDAQSDSMQDSNGIIARHLERALPLSSPTLVARYLRAAGRVHLEKFAFTEARAALARARELMTQENDLSVDEGCHLRFELAEAQLYSLDRQAARRTLLEAAEIARRSNSSILLAECAIRISPDAFSIEVGPFDPEHVQLLRECLRLLPKSEIALRSKVMARLSLALAWSERSNESLDHALYALDLAKKICDPKAMASALAACSDALHGPDRLDRRRRTNQDLKVAVELANSRPGIIMQHVRQASVLLDAGEMRPLDAEISACEAATRHMNAPHYEWYPVAFRAMRALMKGDLTLAEKLGDNFTEIALHTGDANVPAARACQNCALLLERNRAIDAIAQASPFVCRFPGVQAWVAGAAMLSLHAGDAPRAFDVLGTFDKTAIHDLFREPGGSAGIAFLAEVSIAADDRKSASYLYDLCSPIGTRSATLGYAIWYVGCFARYAGLLASSLGLRSESLDHLRAAVAHEKRLGATTWRIHSEIDLANEILKQKKDPSEALALINSAELSAQKKGLERARRRAQLARNTFSAICS